MADKKDDSAKSDDKVFDVAKPGQSAAGPTSRPVILSRSMIKNDPMVVGAKKDSKNAERQDTPKETKVTVTSAPTEADKAEEQKPQPEPAQPEAEDSIPDKSADEPAQTAGKEQTADQPEENDQDKPTKGEASPPSSDSAEIGTLAEEASVGKETQKQQNEEAKQAEAKQKLIDTRQYYLNIGEIKRRRTNARILVVLLVLTILAVVSYGLALDAELLDSNLQPVTDIL
jgi:hypothetical protein